VVREAKKHKEHKKRIQKKWSLLHSTRISNEAEGVAVDVTGNMDMRWQQA